MKRALPWAALGVLALACVLRVANLSRWSLDGDELYSYYDVHRVLAGETWPEGVRSHPLGYAGMALCAALFGEGEGSLRAFAAGCGIAAVAALLFLRRDVLPRPVALAAGLAAALSPWLVFHSQEARFYGPLLLCATLATLWALPGAGRRPVGAALSALAALLCHPSALLLLPCLLLPSLAAQTPRMRWTLLGLAALAAGALGLLVGDAVVDVVQAALTRRTLAHYDALHLAEGFGYNLGPGIGLLALLGAWAAWRTRTEGDRQLVLAAWLPPLVLLLGALLGVSVQQRYAMASVPALLLLAGRGLLPLACRAPAAARQSAAGKSAATAAAGPPGGSCPEGGRARPVLWTSVLLLALAPALPALADYGSTGDRSDMRAAAAWIAEHTGPQDIIVAEEHSLLDLYLSRQGASADRKLIEAPPRPTQSWTLLRHASDCWVVLKRSRAAGAYGEDFKSWVEGYFLQRTRIGSEPPPFVRHDNRLVILQRRERLVESPRNLPPGSGTPPSQGQPTPVPNTTDPGRPGAAAPSTPPHSPSPPDPQGAPR